MRGIRSWLGVRPFLRHSLVLVVAGLVYLAIGATFFFTNPSPYRTQGLYYALHVPGMGYTEWGVVWLLAGFLAIFSARWPPGSETWGYILLTGLSTGWAAFYVAGVLFHDTPPTNIIGALCYGLLGFMWWAISGLVNPSVLIPLVNQIEALHVENLKLHEELGRYKEDRG